jgi:hypothetical protein
VDEDKLQEWRDRWVAELQELLMRIPPGITTQLVEYKGIQIGIRVLEK